MRAYAEETNRLNWERRASGDADRRELEKVERSIKEIVATIEEGSGSRALVTRLQKLEAKEDELKARLAQTPVDVPDIHPNVGGIYRRKVERLAEALRCPEERDEAADAIRALSPSRPAPNAASWRPRYTAISARSWNGRLKKRAATGGIIRECRFQWLRGQDLDLRQAGRA
jgi:hypothetical protein